MNNTSEHKKSVIHLPLAFVKSETQISFRAPVVSQLTSTCYVQSITVPSCINVKKHHDFARHIVTDIMTMHWQLCRITNKCEGWGSRIHVFLVHRLLPCEDTFTDMLHVLNQRKMTSMSNTEIHPTLGVPPQQLSSMHSIGQWPYLASSDHQQSLFCFNRIHD